MYPNQEPGAAPQGGDPRRPAGKKSRKGLVIGIVVCGVIAICGVCSIGAAVGLGKGAKSIEEAADAATKPAGGLNTAVRDGKFEFVVSKMECGAASVGGSFMKQKAQGQYCIVNLSVKNIGKEAQTFFDDNQKALAADGSEYQTDSSATLAVAGDASTWVNEINPGNSVTGKIVFDVPKGVTLNRLVLHDSAFSGGVTINLSSSSQTAAS